jgi:hypothetical protein
MPDPIGIGVSSIVSAHWLFLLPIPILKLAGGALLKGRFPERREEESGEDAGGSE